MNPRYSSRFILFMCLFATVANAQIQFHFGVEGGVPLTDTLVSTTVASASRISANNGSFSFDRYNSETKRLLIGPTLRVDLQHGLGIEFDALYQRVNYDHTVVNSALGGSFFSRSFEQTTANRWQFPLLIQYSRNLSKAKVYAEVGPSISRIANSRSTISSTSSNGSSTSSNTSTVTGQGGTLAGMTAGAGVDLPCFRLHLRPEFRYSHWFSPGASPAIVGFLSLAGFLASGPVSPTFRTTKNEAAFLLGLTF
jgi:hypothetical protein